MPPQWDDVRFKLERRREISTAPEEEPIAEGIGAEPIAAGSLADLPLTARREEVRQAPPPGMSLPKYGPYPPSSQPTSGTILWIDDRPEGNISEVGVLERRGWTVVQVRNGPGAARQLASRKFDVLVSDIDRDGNPNAGFEDLADLRERGYQVPAVFYTGRITPERRERAAGLQASVTNSPDELLDELYRLTMHRQVR